MIGEDGGLREELLVIGEAGRLRGEPSVIGEAGVLSEDIWPYNIRTRSQAK